MTPLNLELVKELKDKEEILMRENSLLVEQTSVLAAGQDSKFNACGCLSCHTSHANELT